MYILGPFQDLGRSAVAHPAVAVRYRYKWRDGEMGIAFAQAAVDEYRRDDTDVFQFPGLLEQS